jgi:predicted transcriptional regulator
MKARQKKTAKKGKIQVTTIRLSAEMKNRIEVAAHDLEITSSSIIRMAVNEFVKKHNANANSSC